MLEDLRPGPEGSAPCDLVLASALNAYFFLADDGRHGRELWLTLGTGDGTHVVEDIYPGSTSAEITWLVSTPSRIYFLADDGALEVGPYPPDDEMATVVGFEAGQVRAGNAVVRLAPDGSGRLVIDAPKLEPQHSVHLVIDVTGYFE